jgi:hypothetical protein
MLRHKEIGSDADTHAAESNEADFHAYL